MDLMYQIKLLKMIIDGMNTSSVHFEKISVQGNTIHSTNELRIKRLFYPADGISLYITGGLPMIVNEVYANIYTCLIYNPSYGFSPSGSIFSKTPDFIKTIEDLKQVVNDYDDPDFDDTMFKIKYSRNLFEFTDESKDIVPKMIIKLIDVYESAKGVL